MNYAGSDWLIRQKERRDEKVSLLGKDVADLLGELFYGIYHIQPEVMKADFSNDYWIEVLIHKSLATFDFNELTRLVFLAHHMAIRVDVGAARNGILRLMFHRRERDGGMSRRHPSIDEALAAFKASVSIPEAK